MLVYTADWASFASQCGGGSAGAAVGGGAVVGVDGGGEGSGKIVTRAAHAEYAICATWPLALCDRRDFFAVQLTIMLTRHTCTIGVISGSGGNFENLIAKLFIEISMLHFTTLTINMRPNKNIKIPG